MGFASHLADTHLPRLSEKLSPDDTVLSKQWVAEFMKRDEMRALFVPLGIFEG